MTDPSTRRSLEEERDFLLRSIEDLDRERDAGDLSDADHAALRDDYVARAAEVLRRLGPEPVGRPTPTKRSSNEPAREPGGGGGPDTAGAPGTATAEVVEGRRGRVWWIAGAAVFAVVAGLLVANFAGERGASDALTGGLEPSLREKNLECQQLGAQGEMQLSLECFDEILAEDPQNVEALTYRGWYLYLTSLSATQSDAEDLAVELRGRAEDNLARAVEIDPGAAEARAFRAVLFNRSGDVEASCAELAILDTLDVAPMISELTATLAESCPD